MAIGGWNSQRQGPVVPLTARHGDAVVDATAVDDDGWAAVHRVRPRAELWCVGCGTRLQAKVSKRQTRFFAHDRLSPGCPSAGETPEHLRLKTGIIRILRELGWNASPEVVGNGWRADVLGTSPSGRRVAFEVQLASMTVEEGIERTERYDRDDVASVWVTSRDAHWVHALPSAKVVEVDDQLLVNRGCAKWAGTGWTQARDIAFDTFAAAVGNETLTLEVIHGFTEHLARGETHRYLRHEAALAWVERTDLDRRQRDLDRARRAEEAERERRRRHAARIEALLERQRRAVPVVAELARRESGLTVWVGFPQRTNLSSAAPVRRFAMGVPVWVGASRPKTLWAVVCPVASRIGSAVRGYIGDARVFTADERERRRVSDAIRRSAEIVPSMDTVLESPRQVRENDQVAPSHRRSTRDSDTARPASGKTPFSQRLARVRRMSDQAELKPFSSAEAESNYADWSARLESRHQDPNVVALIAEFNNRSVRSDQQSILDRAFTRSDLDVHPGFLKAREAGADIASSGLVDAELAEPGRRLGALGYRLAHTVFYGADSAPILPDEGIVRVGELVAELDWSALLPQLLVAISDDLIDAELVRMGEGANGEAADGIAMAFDQGAAFVFAEVLLSSGSWPKA